MFIQHLAYVRDPKKIAIPDAEQCLTNLICLEKMFPKDGSSLAKHLIG